MKQETYIEILEEFTEKTSVKNIVFLDFTYQIISML
jgi:hypothetical protein